MSLYIVQILSGIAGAGLLFLVASGLSLVFGTLRIINFAHGSLYMLGAFLMLSIGKTIGFAGVTFWISLVLASLAVGAIGALLEIVVLRPVYSRSNLTQLMVTFGVVFVVGGAIQIIYGTAPYSTVHPPPFLEGHVGIWGHDFPVYEIFIIGLALAIGGALWFLLYRTSLGRLVRAGSVDSQLLSLSGVRVPWLFTGVFALGAVFAGLAGGIVAARGSVVDGMDVDVIVLAFVIVVIGGMGSLKGAAVAALLVGVSQSLGVLWIPNQSLALVFGVLVVVLAVRPEGLFGERERTAPARLGVPGGSLKLRRLLSGMWLRLPATLARRTSGLASSSTLRALGVILVIAVAFIPQVLPISTTLVATSALIFALFALSLNLLAGTTGLVSFGHALFFGIGAYCLALLATKSGWSPLAALALAPLVGAVAAFITGLVALRTSALYFSLLTLGIGQLFFALATGTRSVTNGTDGLRGFIPPLWFVDPKHMYLFVFAVVAVCTALLYIITVSPFGDALRGIRDNRRRAEFSGVSARRYELAAYVIAGAFGSIAGGLFAFYQLGAYPSLFGWQQSGEAIAMTVLGGIHSFLGPAIGAFFYLFLNDVVAANSRYWELIIGVVIVVVAILAPGGIAGWLERLIGFCEGLLRGRRRPALDGRADMEVDDVGIAVAAGSESVGDAQAVVEARIRRRASAPTLLRVDGVSKAFGGLQAVREVSVDVRKGSVHALIGPNGAGKTTLFNLITGILEPDEGHVYLDDRDITGIRPWQLSQLGVARSFQQASIFWSMSAVKNLALVQAMERGVTRRPAGWMPTADARAVSERTGLAGIPDGPVSELSHGDHRAIEIGVAVAGGAGLLLLDEPTAGLSPTETKAAALALRRIADEDGLTVVFVEHDMDVVFSIADQITVLDHGRLLSEGDPLHVRADEAVRDAYLGRQMEEVG